MKMTRKWTTKVLSRFYIQIFFSSIEIVLRPFGFGFCMNYHDLDPVSADKNHPKCPNCILILLPMNIQQLALISPLFSHLYWYLTMCVIMCQREKWQKEVALIYDAIWPSVTRSKRHEGASSPSSIRTWLKFIKVKTTLIYYLAND